MPRLLLTLLTAAAVLGCSKPAAPTTADQPKTGGDPVKSPADGPKPAATEEEAVKFVEGLGGTVKRDEALPGKPVTAVKLTGKRLTDTGLKNLAPLVALTTLDLDETDVTDAGLKELAPLTKLTTLSVGGPRVTDAGLSDLAKIKTLKTVTFGPGTKVTAAEARKFQKSLPGSRVSVWRAKGTWETYADTVDG